MDKVEGMKERKNYSTLQNSMYILNKINLWHKTLIPMSTLYIILSSFDVFMLPILVKYVIEQVYEQKEILTLMPIVLIYIVVVLTIYLLKGFYENQEWWKIQSCRMNFMQLVMRTTLTMDYEKLEDPKMLDNYQKAMNATTSDDKGVGGMLKSMIIISILLSKTIAASIIICTLSPILVILMFIIILVQFIPTDRTKKRDKKEVWDELIPYWRKFFDLNYITQNFEYGKDIRLYNMSEWIHKKHLEVNAEIQKKILHSRNLWLKCQVILRVFYFLQEIILYTWLVYNVLYRELSIGDFTLYVSVVRSFSSAVGDLLWQYATMRNHSEEINDYRFFLEHNNGKNATITLLGKNSSFKNELGQFEFKFENVSFRYEGQEKYAIRNLNMTIESGKRLAVVGLNGAGKSTMIKLICRLYEPTEGRILLNGIDIRKFDKAYYFSLFSPVFQNVEIYAFSIAENVSMKIPTETDYTLAESCLINAGLEYKIQSLVNGVRTQLLKIIHDEGVDLSGGEKQKLVLARALYKDAPVILLDEPTAALDPIAEYNQYKDFDKLVGDKTAIYISHRLSSTQFCDCIAMFEEGKMIEFGNHHQLLMRESSYSKLFRLQSQYYI